MIGHRFRKESKKPDPTEQPRTSIIVRGERQKQPWSRILGRRWPFLLAWALLGTILTAGVLLLRPPIWEAQATVRFDPQRYGFAVQQEPGGGRAIHPNVVQEARDLLNWQHPADLLPSPQVEQPIEFRAGAEGTLLATGRATEPERAQEIAAHGGQALADSLSSMRGWSLLRTLLRRAIALQGQGRPEPPSPLTPHLFDLLDAGFLTYDPAIPPTPVQLSAQDVADVTLAVQRMEERYTARVNALFTHLARTQDEARRASITAEIGDVVGKRERLRQTLITLNRQKGALVQQKDGAVPPELLLPSEPRQNPAGLARWWFLLAGAGGGLLIGAALALCDDAYHLSGRLRELLAYRDLVWNLVVRDLKARYKSSFLGYLWSLINPLLMMVVFTVLFKFLLKSNIPNFPVFIIVGLLPWNFCATSVSGAVTSITGQGALIKKVYFPREAIPIALVGANLINYILALPAMLAIMLVLNAHLQWSALLFPLIALIQTIFLLGLALFLSCLNVFFRDTQVIMEVLLTAWFFLTPIFYRLSDIVDARLGRLVRWLNPMASLVDFYRDIFYLGGLPGWDAIIRTLVTALLVLLVGYLFFVRFSSRFGEEV